MAFLIAKSSLGGEKHGILASSSGKFMFGWKFYESMNREEIAAQIRKEGFDPIYVHDPPGRIYAG
jgi:hypothetical protein